MTMTEQGLTADFAVSLKASIDGLAAAARREADWRNRMATVIRQIPFTGIISLTAGAGTLDQPDSMQAKTGYIWSIRRLTAQGFSAGSVTAYRNSVVGEPVMPFPVPAVNTISRGEVMLMPDDRLVWSATGITGTVQVWGVADCFESWYLPHYLG